MTERHVDRRDLLLAAAALLTGAAAAGGAAAAPANACIATAAHDESLRRILAEVKAGTAPAETAAMVAANRCPLCGCALTNPFTGRPQTSSLF
ncbi:MAG: hypothetical protein OHK0024_09750 [Thalassobaculales bacterium]